MFNNRKILQRFSWSLLIKGAGAVATFFVGLVVAKFSTAGSAGNFFLLLAWVSACGTIARCGMDQVILRRASILPEKKGGESHKSFYSNGMALVIISSTFIGSLFLLFSSFLASVNCLFIGFYIVLLPIYSLCYYQSFFYQARGYLFFLQVAQNLGVSALFVVGVYILSSFFKNLDFLFLAAAYFLSFSFILVILFFFSKKHDYFFDLTLLSFVEVKKLFLESYPWISLSIAMLSFNWLGQIFIGFMGDSKAVALYSIALQVSLTISLISMAMNSYAFPKLALFIESGRTARLKDFCFSSMRLLLGVSVPIYVTILFFCKNILNLFGQEYSEAYSSVLLLSSGQLINVFGSFFVGLLSMAGMRREVLIVSCLSSLVILMGCLSLIPYFSYFGASLSYVVGLLVLTLGALFFTVKRGVLSVGAAVEVIGSA